MLSKLKGVLLCFLFLLVVLQMNLRKKELKLKNSLKKINIKSDF